MNIINRIQDIFRDIFDDESLEINESTNAEDIEEWDELSHIDIITAVEDEFSMRFRTREVSGVKNAGEISEIIMERAGTRSEI